MRIPKRKRNLIVLAIGLFLLIGYVGQYRHVRQDHYLVHYSSFADGKTAKHRIDIGDFPGMTGPWVWHIVFTPLRWAETGYWYIRHPPGQPWPYSIAEVITTHESFYHVR